MIFDKNLFTLINEIMNECIFNNLQRYNVKKVVKTIEKYGPDGTYLGKEIITKETYDEVPNTVWLPDDKITISYNIKYGVI